MDFYTESAGNAYPLTIVSGHTLSIKLTVRYLRHLINPIFGLTIKTKEGVTLYGSNTELLSALAIRDTGALGSTVMIAASFVANMAPGDYFISLGVATRQGETITPHDRRYDAIHFVVEPHVQFFGLAQMNMSCV